MKSTSATVVTSSPIRTKFYRPPLPRDLVERPRLIDQLDLGLDSPLTLVSAPAGYGKSTLVSTWLHSCERPSVWISLDETMDDLSAFLTYLVTAIQAVFPSALQLTQTLLTAISVPPLSALSGSLINELDEVERDFILVLDDYHSIHNREIHELLTAILQPPAKHMHLVLITRRDPPLPQSRLLARNQMTEIRVADLRFSPGESADFMQNALSSRLPDEAMSSLARKTEGWIASLRLAALTLRNRPDVESKLAELQALEHNRNLSDYLMNEVLAQAPDSVTAFLLKTAVLDQMCGPLCEALLGREDQEMSSQSRLEWLEQNNLFTVSLDSERHWYRYHHLFRSFLRSRLERQHDAGEVDLLHARASDWYARQGSLEEALHHALLGHDLPAAVRLAAEHRHALMDAEQWQLHERTFRVFPAETVEEYPDLLLMAAWRDRLGGSNATRVLGLVDRAEALASQLPDQSDHALRLRGEIDTLRAIVAYEAAGDPERAIELARRALATTPQAWYYVRASAWLYMAIAYQMSGKLDKAEATVCEGEPEDVASDGSVRARVAASRCFIGWMAGDLQSTASAAIRVGAIGEKHHRQESLSWCHYLLASVAYQQNDLVAAEAHARVAEDMRYLGRPMAYAQSAFIYASIYQARGLAEQARQKLDFAFEFLTETGSDGLILLAEAFRAELAVMRGDLATASEWATQSGSGAPLTAMSYFYAPQLTLPKVLLAQGTPASRARAAEELSRLRTFVTSIHNTRFTIEVLALEALLHHAEGNLQDALAALGQAVKLGRPGGLLRVFVDLGPTLANLLRRLTPRGDDALYIDRILSAFPAERPGAQPPPLKPAVEKPALVEPLSRRELQVLDLLALRMSSKEIAAQLILSEETVRRHRANIYQKLAVHSHRQAITAAVELGILPSASGAGRPE